MLIVPLTGPGKVGFGVLPPATAHCRRPTVSATTAAPASLQRPGWIVSAWWDMAYIVVTPLLIVPVVLILARHWLTAEEVSLAVIAFASLGHHLPGFMRAYGDRELFRRSDRYRASGRL